MSVRQLRGVKALQVWIKRVISNYRNVTVVDFSRSFRSGLVFCAIIHHFRPGLMDYESLSDENVHFNNSLAFRIAETELGIPSLLDPQVKSINYFYPIFCIHVLQDMVDLIVPDRYSIITYVSQFYHKFKDEDGSRLITFDTRNETTCPAA